MLKSIAPFVLCLLAVTSTAAAQSPCSLQTVTGTYAIQTTGFSAWGAIMNSPIGPAYQLFGAAAVFVGRATIEPDGAVTGTYQGVWINAPVPPTPFSTHITVNADCTGEWIDGAGVVDKIVVLGNGKEIRTTGWSGAGNSVTTFQRIGHSMQQAPVCGQQTLQGTYAQLCQGISVEPDSVGTVNMLLIWTAKDGSLSGTLKENRFGFPAGSLTESAIAGTYTINSDCTADVELTLDAVPGITVKAGAALFDEGKQGFSVPLGFFAGETMVLPPGPVACEVTRIR